MQVDITSTPTPIPATPNREQTLEVSGYVDGSATVYWDETEDGATSDDGLPIPAGKHFMHRLAPGRQCWFASASGATSSVRVVVA